MDLPQKEGTIIFADIFCTEKMGLQILDVMFQLTPAGGRITERLNPDMAQSCQRIAEGHLRNQAFKYSVDLWELGKLDISGLHTIQIPKDLLYLSGPI